MGKIRKILETELVGGTQSTDVYPVTSTKAVYDTNNKVLDDYIQHLKKTSTFAGIATPTTNPDTPDGPVFYIAGEGTYANFSNIVIEAGQLGILKWNGTWSKEVLKIGAGGGGGGVVDTAAITKIVNDTIKNVSWWGQTINNNKVDGNIVITKGSHSFTIELDDNGNLKFNGNIYATGGITALGVGSTPGGGSGASLGTLLTQLNNENPFPTANGQVLTYDGSNFIWKTPTGGSGVALNPTMSAMNNQLGKTTLNTPQFLYWDGSTYTWKNESEISGGSGGSSTGGSVDLSSYLTKTEASTTYAAKSHTHSTNEINGLSDYVQGVKVNNATNADRLLNSRTIWGQSFNGTGDINGNLYMGSEGGGSIQLWMNNGNILDRTNNTLHIGYGLKASSDGEINLDAYRTVVYTDNMSKHYDFKSNVFDVNSNQIHFGSETNGGKISWDAANNAFKIEGNVYATGGITALGVSNSATTSNNVDFTFRSVTSKRNIIYSDDNYPFKIYPKNNTDSPLIIYNDGAHWNIYDDNHENLILQSGCIIDSDGWVCSPQFSCIDGGNMKLDGCRFHLGNTDNNVDVVFYYNGSPYKLDMSKAISIEVFTKLSKQELSTLQARMIKKKAVS